MRGLSSTIKRYARVHTIMAQEKKPKTWKDKAISFGFEDLEGAYAPHDDAIVITATINSDMVKRVLFDNGSASDYYTMTP